MAETDSQTGIDRGLYPEQRSRAPGPSMAEGIAAALTLLWLVAVALFFLFVDSAAGGFDALRFLIVLFAVFMPVAMIWLGALAARVSRTTRDEADRLYAAIDGLRRDLNAQRKMQPAGTPDVSGKLDKIAEAQKKAEVALSRFISIRPVSEAPRLPQESAPEADQPGLALGTPAEATRPPLGMDDFITALQFPADPDDNAGFRALRKALADRKAAQLITAAQDVLTLLSEDGIYMDDLRPDRARVELWRQFARGERGRAIGALGGIRDRSSLALSASRMRQDTIFRDAAHHFLRLFDHTLADIEPVASDTEIARLTDTRSARAFMLLGRVTGMFD